MNQMKIYIKNIMKINQFKIFIICVLFGLIIANNNFNDKQETLNEIQIEIQNLENELKEQIKNQKGTQKKITEIKNQIVIEKKELLKKQNQESYQLQLLKNINNVIDSLTQSSLKTEKEKNKIQNLISNIKINQESATEQIVTLNEELINIKNKMNKSLDTLDLVKQNIRNIISETVLINPPDEIEFIIESNTWDNYILNKILYEMVIDSKKELLINLIQKKEELNTQYNQNLNLQNAMINSKKDLNKELNEYKELVAQLNNNMNIIEKILTEKKVAHQEIKNEYQEITNNLNMIQNEIALLKKEKNTIQNEQKKIDDDKKRIEYALILKKESREKVEKEIKKLLEKTSQYKGSNIAKFKNKLLWPLEGEIITKFGINVSPSGTKFDYTSIEIVGDKILYLVNEINPKNPNKNLVKQFQRITMNLKSGDTGYGVFGPQTTKQWKKYNEIKLTTKDKQPILAIHQGKIEKIKFIDPITGVLIMIRHNDQSLSSYSGHIDLIVSENDIVLSGQKIGFIKSENILAFTLLINGKIVNPSDWLIKK